jgi:hypothetical protein
MRNRKRLAVLCCLLTIAVVTAAVVFWPTPRRRALARVEALDGTFEKQVDEEAGSRKVYSLILASRPLTELDLIALGDLRPIHRLMLDGCPLKYDWLAHIAALEELELLTLTGCPITDAGLVHLKGLKHLKNLSLRNTPVTDAGLVHLQQLTGLLFLNVAYSRVTERGVEEFKRTLPDLKKVYIRDEPD